MELSRDICLKCWDEKDHSPLSQLDNAFRRRFHIVWERGKVYCFGFLSHEGVSRGNALTNCPYALEHVVSEA